MNLSNKQEMMERFRLYGEILMLCVDMFGPYMDESLTYSVDKVDFEAHDVDVHFNIETDDDFGEFNGLEFNEGSLMVCYAENQAVYFFDVESDSLQEILDALNKFKEDLKS